MVVAGTGRGLVLDWNTKPGQLTHKSNSNTATEVLKIVCLSDTDKEGVWLS